MKTYSKLLTLAAATAMSAALVPASARELPSPHIDRGTVKGHAYQDGGIGKDQRARMARQAQRYDPPAPVLLGGPSPRRRLGREAEHLRPIRPR